MKQKISSLRLPLISVMIVLFCLLPLSGFKAYALPLADNPTASITLSAPGAVSEVVLAPVSGTSLVQFDSAYTVDSVRGAGKIQVLASNSRMFVPGETYRIALSYMSLNSERYSKDDSEDEPTVFHLNAYINGSATPVEAAAYYGSSGNQAVRSQQFKLTLPNQEMVLTLDTGAGFTKITLPADEYPAKEGTVHQYTLPDESSIPFGPSAKDYNPRNYKTLAGWSVKASTDEADVLFKGGELLDWYKMQTQTDTPELYAVWKPVSMTVTLDANDGSGKSATEITAAQQSYTPNSSLISPLPGNVLKGWATTPTGTPTDTFDLKKTDSALTLYAIWDHTVSFDANGGSGTMPARTVSTGKTLTLPTSTFTEPAHKYLMGWSATSDGAKLINSVLVTESTTIYAIWGDNEYTVSFDANGGSGTIPAKVVKAGQLTLPTGTFTAPAGKQFKGWSTAKNGSTLINSLNVTDDITIYAIWDNKETEKPAETEKAGTETDKAGETEKAGTGTDKSGETEKAGTGSDKAGETEKAGTGTDKAGETEKAGTGTDKSGETEKAGTGTDKAGETEKAGTETEKAAETSKTTKAVAKGTTIKDKKTAATYKVTNASKRTVEYVKPTKKTAKVTIPATITYKKKSYKVTSIAANAFRKNTKLTSVTIGKNVTKIGDKAFSTCKKLKTVKIGKNVTTIGKYSFYKCTALTKITIPAKVKKINTKAFYGCKKLKTITISTSLLTAKGIGSKAFTGIYKKAQIKVPSKKLKAYKKLLAQKGVGKNAKINK